MERYINIKRTKMIDEASRFHKPDMLIGYIWKFGLVILIAMTASSIIQTIPLVLYLLIKTDIFALAAQVANGSMTQDEYLNACMNMITDLPVWFIILSLFLTVTSIIAAIFYCKKFEKRSVASMGLRKGNIAGEYLVGTAIGFLMFGLTFLIAYATGTVELKLNPDGFAPVIILFLIGYIIQGASEEIMVRGFLMVSIARDYKLWIAIVVSSVAFSMLHLGNNSIGFLALINITLFGIFEAIYICKRGNLWGACAIHSMWNFAQGNIFGSSVSGNAYTPSVFIMSYDPERVVANGGAFGLEAGVASTIVLLVAIGVALLMKTKEKELSELEKPLNINVNIQ